MTIINSNNADGVLGAAKYGVGFRLTLEIEEMASDGDIELGQLAAQAELGQARVMFSVELKGFDEDNFPTIPDDLVNLRGLDIDQYAKIQTLMNNVLKHFTNPANSDSYQPELLGVNLRKLYEDDAEDIIRFGNYALWRIIKGSSLKESFALAEEKSVLVNTEIVKQVYAMIFQREEFVLPGSESTEIGTRKPTSIEKSIARIWLKDFKNVSTYDAARTSG